MMLIEIDEITPSYCRSRGETLKVRQSIRRYMDCSVSLDFP
jgi:hypothetical protein